MAGTEEKLQQFVNYLKKEKEWTVEEKGPFPPGSKFHLKRQFDWWKRSCAIRCDRKQYDNLEKDVPAVHSRFYKKTPMSSDFGKKDESPELEGEAITKYRSIVGKLMYISGERPDAQHAIQCLARSTSKPTEMAMKNAEHVVSYLFGTSGYGVMMDSRKRGQSVMDVRSEEEATEATEHLIEVVTDADYAGNKNDRRSTSSFQIFVDGNLVESRVRAQKAIALSSGESEFVAMVAGCSEGLLVRHLWNKLTGRSCTMKARSDSSAARSMVQRQGIGRVRHLDASLLWIQQKEKEKILSVAPIPTDLNCADIGTKNLAKKRLLGLLYMLKMVNAVYDRIGEEEYEEIERTYQIKQSHKQIGNKKALRVCLLLLLANIDFIIVVAHLMDIEKVTIQNTENEVRMILERKDQATQATCLEDNSMQKKMDEEVAEMQAEYVKQDMYIEQLEERVKELQEQAAENFQMYELESRHARKLMNQMINLRKTPKGQCVHFSTRCPHFQEALKLELCR